MKEWMNVYSPHSEGKGPGTVIGKPRGDTHTHTSVQAQEGLLSHWSRGAGSIWRNRERLIWPRDLPPSKAKPQACTIPPPLPDHVILRTAVRTGSWGTLSDISDIREHIDTLSRLGQYPSPATSLPSPRFYFTVLPWVALSLSGPLSSCAHGVGLAVFCFVFGNLIIHCHLHEC